MRGQVWHSFLRDDILHLTLQKQFKKTAIMIGSLFLIFNSWQVRIKSDLTCQVAHTSVTWLSPVIRCWTVCPSMVVICWIYALSSWWRHGYMGKVTGLHLQKQTLEHIGCPVPDLLVLELQWCVPVPGPAASLGWSLSGVPAGLWDMQIRSWTVLWLFLVLVQLISF